MGKDPEDMKKTILKMKRIAEIYEGEELELVSYEGLCEPPEKCNIDMWNLGTLIQNMATADVFIGLSNPTFVDSFILAAAAKGHGYDTMKIHSIPESEAFSLMDFINAEEFGLHRIECTTKKWYEL